MKGNFIVLVYSYMQNPSTLLPVKVFHFLSSLATHSMLGLSTGKISRDKLTRNCLGPLTSFGRSSIKS